MKKIKITLKLKKVEQANYVIYVVCNFKRQTYAKTTQLQFPQQCWVNDRITNKGDFRQAKEYNTRLLECKNKLEELINNYLMNSSQIDRDKLDQDWKDFLSNGTKVDLLTFNLRKLLDSKRLSVGNGRALPSYELVYKNVADFDALRNQPTHISDLNAGWMDAFSGYLVGNNYSNNTINKKLSTLKTMLRLLKRNDKDIKDNCLDYRFSQKSYNSPKPIITQEEFERLLNLKVDWSLRPTLVLFLIGCLTGLRYSDLIRLTKDYIKGKEYDGEVFTFLEIITKKTQTLVIQDITNSEILMNLLEEKFRRNIKVSCKTANIHIKEICKIAKIDSLFESYRNEGTGKVHFKKPKYELISTHTARRSYINNLIIKGVDSELIMDLTGITSNTTFKTYQHLSKSDIRKRLINSPIKHTPYKVA